MRLRGVGTDIVDVRRFARLVERHSFTSRWFTVREMDHCLDREDAPGAVAALFAAKEAAWKALRIEWRGGVPWSQMEVLPHGGGFAVVLTRDVALAAEAVGVQRILVTTAVEGDLAMAHALAVLHPAQPSSDAR